MKSGEYLQLIAIIERLHRQFLEVVKLELDRSGVHDINNVQALLLFDIAPAEMTIGELTLRGAYLGSNVSYNVKKMVERGYLTAERSSDDLRSIRVKLTRKGRTLRELLSAMHGRHIARLAPNGITDNDLQGAARILQQLERLWLEARNYHRRA
jgi:DNA-binding MarR family transcriptional regulator